MIQHLMRALSVSQRKALDLMSREVAASSEETVYRLVVHSVDSMSLSETRGYIRARASREVRRRTRRALADIGESGTDQIAKVARRSTERLVPVVMRRLSAVPPRALRLSNAA